jgi:two-component system, chemotaxis family, protein-glutamate methylesterase/glutaminase
VTPPIRVLVVEDSVTVRKYLCGVLDADPALKVVGEAGDGKRAIELCDALRPDVVTMDMMLPVMSGLSATEYIMAHRPTPILIVSASTNRGELFKTYDALAAGAMDVLEKPNGDDTDSVWEAQFRSTVKLMSRVRVITHPRARLRVIGRPAGPASVPVAPPTHDRGKVVAIGASTGGPGAIVEILRALPASFPLPLLLVLHIAEPFAAAFADWLDAQTVHRVSYGRDGELISVRAGQVIMAPPEFHMTVRNGRVQLNTGVERHSCRPSVDVLFESVAAEYGASAVACLLTGMGRDGAAGLLEVRRAGGTTIAQDESTSVVYGMPREAVMLGAAESVLPLGEIAPALAAIGARAEKSRI